MKREKGHFCKIHPGLILTSSWPQSGQGIEEGRHQDKARIKSTKGIGEKEGKYTFPVK
jgi:hypothetical protein